MTTQASMYSGDSKDLTVLVTNRLGQLVGADLVQASAISYGIYDKANPETALLTKTLGEGVTVDEVNSTILVEIAPADTVGFEPNLYIHEVQVTLLSGKVHTVLQGKIDIKKGYLP